MATEGAEHGAQFNPFLPEIQRDPYPFYHRLRAADPVHWNGQVGVWFLTRHADVVTFLTAPHVSADRRRGQAALTDGGPAAQSLLTLDPPDHTRLRNLVNRAFTPRTVEQLRPRIEAIIAELLDRTAGQAGMEAIGEFAYPLPVQVIAEMLGVPPEDHRRFQAWADAIAANLDPTARARLAGEVATARAAFRDYFRGIIDERRREPRDDLISALAAVEEQGDRMTEEELLAMCNLLLIAGHETTVNLLGNGLKNLLQHPEQVARLRADRGLTESAIEELLRFESPVQMTGRVCEAEMQLGGKTIQPGQAVVALLGAANRDPEQFPDPEQLQLDRTPNQHLAFGRGIHFCLGAPLARLEAAIAFPALLDRFPGLHLAGEPELRPTFVLRGLSKLPIAF